MKRTVFLGTPQFAVPTLKALLESPEIEVLAVITQPDQKSGRGQKFLSPPVKVLALENDIPVFQFPSIRKNPDAFSLLDTLAPDVCVVVAFGQILPSGFFDIPPLGTLNVHASVLPAYRGAAPVIHAVLNGEKESGVTIMQIDEGMDTGKILRVEKVNIPIEMTAGELESILARLGAELLVKTLVDYASDKIKPVEQDHGRATYAPRIHKEMGRIDWKDHSWDIHNQIRAFNPRPGAFANFRNAEVKIWRSRFGEGRGGENQPGSIICLKENEIIVQCGSDTTLSLMEFQTPNRKMVSARDFINGNRVTDSDLFE